MTQDPFQPPQAPLESSEAARAVDLKSAKRYIVGAFVIGVAEVFDASNLIKNSGEIGGISIAVSIAELLWFIVSIYVLFKVEHRGTKMLAAFFVAYNVLGWIVGSMWVEGDTMPFGLAVAGGVIGLAYAVGAGFVGKPHLLKPK
ncbi:MAG TPA: hypothetical protein VKR38_13625 [Usitatibacter sp.]|nr:hypothetical protein [Usitatibacter sp.]